MVLHPFDPYTVDGHLNIDVCWKQHSPIKDTTEYVHVITFNNNLNLYVNFFYYKNNPLEV